MQHEVYPSRVEQVGSQCSQHPAGCALVTHLFIRGPGSHHSLPGSPDIVDPRVLVDQSLRQTFDPGAGANFVDSIDLGLFEIADDHRVQVTARSFDHPYHVFTGHRLAQSAADTESLLDDGVELRFRRRCFRHRRSLCPGRPVRIQGKAV